MNCTKCGNVTNLLNSQSIGISVKRFRQCPKCGTKMETYEIPETHLKTAEAYLQLE